MKKFISTLILAAVALSPAHASRAQLPAPNEAGVTMGHVHLNVRDIEASKKFYLGLGGTSAKLGSMEVIKFPGVLFILRKADPTNGMEGSAVNHIGFVEKDGEGQMARMKEQGVKIASNGMDWRGGYVYSPEGVKIELIPRPTLAVALQFDQVHFFVADPFPGGGSAWSQLQTWYTKIFGAETRTTVLSPPSAGNFASAPMSASVLAGVNFRFSKVDAKTMPTRGRAMDHIGFEVKNLEAFCKQLEAKGVKLDVPYSYRKEEGIGIAFVTDPMGTYIELNEGLGRL
jgi:catechol 2,3-dioxygenase-like lactoylglutathione lyase family enzyme